MRPDTNPSHVLVLAFALVFSNLAGAFIGAVHTRVAPAASEGGAGQARTQTTSGVEQARAAYGQIALSFEANRGQTDPAVNFLARGAGYALFLKPDEAVFQLQMAEAEADGEKGRKGEGEKEAALTNVSLSPHLPVSPSPRRPVAPSQKAAIRNPQSAVLRMKLVGSDAGAVAEGADELEGKVNYFTGSDPSEWRTDVPTYGRVRYRGVYPGIDLVYYGNQRQLEYDFVVAPGSDARAVGLRFEGADKVEVDEGGDLLLTLGEAVIRQPEPFIYQEVAGHRRAVEGGYVVEAGGRVGFAVGDYDARLPLVIDPVIVYSTYLGGSAADQGNAIAVDSAGNAYVAGFTLSTNFPTANAFQGTNGGFQDAFVTKLNAAGTAFVYSTYFGGTAQEQARGLAVDSAGNAYVTGITGSTNFPLANAIQATKGATNEDAFVTKLNAAGSALVYSTYLGGGESSEFGEGIAVDSAGNVYATGITFSDDFPVVNPIQATFGGGTTDAYVTKINAAGTALVYSTYLGGTSTGIGGDAGISIAVDSSGNAYVTGDTSSANFPTANAVQASNGGGQDAFVTKINAAGSAFVYSTYLGGSEQDDGEGITADAAGNAYLTGNTFSTNFPTANAIQPTHGGGVIQDAFVTKLNAAGSAFVYSTYLGGTGGEIGFGIAVDSSGNAYIAGGTGSFFSFPTANAIQCRSIAQDAFVTKLNAAGSAFVYSTYLGGSDQENGRGIAIDSSGSAYVTGFTHSTDYPVVNPIQSTFAGGDGLAGDAFVTKLADTSAGPASQLQFTQTAVMVQEDVTFVTLTVQRTGDTSGPVTVDYASADGTATERHDYTTMLGTLRFAAGETAKNVVVLVNEDSKVEGNETFNVSLSKPTGGATLSCPSAVAAIQIIDDTSEPSTNANDDSQTFVGQQYHDFLSRQADAAGLQFWTDMIEACGANAQCREERRINVSAAFFLSIEFQQTGYFYIRAAKAAFGSQPENPRYRPFMRDVRRIADGVVMGTPGAEQLLEANKQAFLREYVARPEFTGRFPSGQSAGAFVDALFAGAGVTPSAGERQAAINEYGTGDTEGRAKALRSVADSDSVFLAQYNPAFVLMQYFGYLRRNPDDPQDTNFDGYNFWLAKMNSFSLPGENVRDDMVALRRVKRAEMVKAFISSIEYRGRFGQP